MPDGGLLAEAEADEAGDREGVAEFGTFGGEEFGDCDVGVLDEFLEGGGGGSGRLGVGDRGDEGLETQNSVFDLNKAKFGSKLDSLNLQ